MFPVHVNNQNTRLTKKNVQCIFCTGIYKLIPKLRKFTWQNWIKIKVHGL